MKSHFHFKELNMALNNLRTLEVSGYMFPESWISDTAKRMQDFADRFGMKEHTAYRKVLEALTDSYDGYLNNRFDYSLTPVFEPILTELDNEALEAMKDEYEAAYENFENKGREADRYQLLLIMFDSIRNTEDNEDDEFFIYLLDRLAMNGMKCVYPMMAWLLSCNRWKTGEINRIQLFRDVLAEGMENGCFDEKEKAWNLLFLAMKQNHPKVFTPEMIKTIMDIFIADAQNGDKPAQDAIKWLKMWQKTLKIRKKEDVGSAPTNLNPALVCAIFDKYRKDCGNEKVRKIIDHLRHTMYPAEADEKIDVPEEIKRIMEMTDIFVEENGLTMNEAYISLIDSYYSSFECSYLFLSSSFDKESNRRFGLKILRALPLLEKASKDGRASENTDEPSDFKARRDEYLKDSNYMKITCWTYRDNEPVSSSSQRIPISEMWEGKHYILEDRNVDILEITDKKLRILIDGKEYTLNKNSGGYEFRNGCDGNYEDYVIFAYKCDYLYDKIKSLVQWTIQYTGHCVKNNGIEETLNDIEYFLYVLKSVYTEENPSFARIRRRLFSIRYHLRNNEIPDFKHCSL